MTSAEACEYILVSAHTDDAIHIALEYANRFLASYGSEAQVVSFYEPIRRKVPATSPIVHWTDLAAQGDEVRLHEDALRRLDCLGSGLTYEFLPVFRSQRINLHYAMYRAIMLRGLLNGEHRPLCFIVPGTGTFGPVASIKVQRSSGVPSDVMRTSPRRFGEALRKHISSTGGHQKRLGRRKDVCLVTLDDVGSLVNLDPAIAVCKELKKRCLDLLVITTTPVVTSAMTQAGVPARLVANRSLSAEEFEIIRDQVDYNICRMLGIEGLDTVDREFLSTVGDNLISWARDHLLINAELERVDQEYTIQSVLSIGSIPLTQLAGERYQDRGSKLLIYFPIIQHPLPVIAGPKYPTFYRHDIRYLVSGDYFARQLVDLAIPEASITCVGSTTYDKSHGRNRDADRQHTRTRILKNWGPDEKLVVIATEHIRRPFEEIDPAVRSLLAIDGTHIVIKVHPSDDLDMFEQYARSLVVGEKLEVVKSCDLIALLHAADLVIAIYSNVIINAAVLGTPTLVCDFSNKRAAFDFVAAGLSLGCFDPAHLPQMLKEMLEASPLRETAEELLRRNIRQFNGANDGQSAVRVAQAIAAATP
jgi:UDP-N-acetylglucosamine 2-epimerase